MATVEDTDTESVSGDYVGLGDVHTHGDEEFYECVDEDEMDNEYFDTQDFQDNESALNQTLHDLFVPKHDEFKMRLAYDDDKQWYNHFIRIKDMLLGVDSKLKRCRCSFSFWISCVCALS